MKLYVLILLLSVLISILFCAILLPLLRKIKASQPILKYVEEHKGKSGTPTMGGLSFILSTILIWGVFSKLNGRLALVSVAIGIAYMLVGFLDDFLKIKKKENEGLKAYQKIIFQFCVALIAGFFCYFNGLFKFFVPFYNKAVTIKSFIIPLVIFVFVAITNSVNLTDGLDGLSSSVSVSYLFVFVILLILESNSTEYLTKEESSSLIILAISLIGSLLGFLCFNVNKAQVFMGDTGSLALGGIIGAVSIFSGNTFFVPIIGIMFVLSSISVIMQVLYFKRTKKRIFLMAPLHHHFQHKGLTESKIAYLYSLITLLLGFLSVLAYM